MTRKTYLLVILVLFASIIWIGAAEAYVIGEEDMLQISVWGNPDLSVHVPVRPDGMISVPLVGDVKAAGATPQELKKILEKELARYVKTPVVSVIVTAINSFKVYIFGDGVSRTPNPAGAAPGAAGGTAAANNGQAGQMTSGQITLRRNTTLLQLLAQLGSLGDIDLKNSYLLRAGKMVDVNFENLVVNGDVSQDVPLVSNDIIYLPAGFNSRIRVTGAVKTPGVFPYAGGMTALDAVLIAGGFTEFASQNDVLILRREGTTIKHIEVKLKDVMNGNIAKNVPLKPGDIVTVKTGMF